MEMYRKYFLLFALWIFAALAIANDKELITSYVKKNFPQDFRITANQIKQLNLAIDHVRPTQDMDAKINVDMGFIEIGRALTRLYCAQLLRNGNHAAYRQFVDAQLQTNRKHILSFANFTKLSQHIQNLSENDYNLIETAAILSAVSLAKPTDNKIENIAHDKDTFLAMVVRNNSDFYPLLTDALQNNNEDIKKMLYVLFPPQTNFRHMLYTENGVGMFKYIRMMIKQRFLDKHGLDIWYAHWMINIAGFRGHVAQNGSMYLNDVTAESMQYLYQLITKMLDSPNFNPLIPYLEYRANLLGLNDLPEEERLFITHIGCLLRFYDKEEGVCLRNAMNKVPKASTQYAREYFIKGLQDQNQIVHTHVPALFGNALQATNGDLEQVLQTILPAYNSVIKNTPVGYKLELVFAKLCSAPNIARLLQEPAPKLKLANDGLVYLVN